MLGFTRLLAKEIDHECAVVGVPKTIDNAPWPSWCPIITPADPVLMGILLHSEEQNEHIPCYSRGS